MGLLPLLALALALPWEREGTRFTLQLDDGRAELDWVSAATFRFLRAWDNQPSPSRPGASAPVEISETDSGLAVEFRSRYLTVQVRKSDLRLTVRDGQGGLLLAESAGARREGGAVVLESALGEGERIYGLGALTLGPLDRRGMKLETQRPFLWSSGGWGRYFPSGENHAVDLGGGRCRVAIPGAARVEHYFYYGPAPKEILEQHLVVAPQVVSWSPGDLDLLKPDRLPPYAVRLPAPPTLPDLVTRLNHASLSAIQMPVIDLGPLTGPLARVAPLVASRAPDESLAHWRIRLRPYLYAYFQEAHDRGIPVLRPLPMQFARDPEAPKHSDVFMFGDEFLVAAGGRELYLPPGVWTELRTNRTYTGRRVIPIEATADELPLFARNGSIIPFLEDPATDRVEAHYFPQLAGEFFIFEPDLGEHTQLHASPAGDLYRFEIESKVDREYEWVAHHLPAPQSVAHGETLFTRAPGRNQLRPGTWFYDAARDNLHIRVKAPAGADVIVNVGF